MNRMKIPLSSSAGQKCGCTIHCVAPSLGKQIFPETEVPSEHKFGLPSSVQSHPFPMKHQGVNFFIDFRRWGIYTR